MPAFRWLVLSLPAILLVMALSQLAPASASGTAVVAAASGNLISGAPGPSAVFPVTVANVQKLGAATVVVGYDPTSLKPVACQRGPTLDVGVCNRNYDRNNDGIADAVFFSVLSLNGVNTDGTAIPLANITWQAVAAVPVESVTALTVEVRTFTDTDGWALAYTAQNGQITLLPPPPPTMTPTPTATATETSTPTMTPTVTETPSPTATPHERRLYLPLVIRAP